MAAWPRSVPCSAAAVVAAAALAVVSTVAGASTDNCADPSADRDSGRAAPAGPLLFSHDICIVGAGPGGLQLGHLLLAAGRDFVVLDRASKAGSFFATFPVHRRLISLNKRFTARADPEFNLRHDWNSLLDNDDVVPMTNRTAERWPDANVLVEYLRDFAQAQEAAGKVRYSTEIVGMARLSDNGHEHSGTHGGLPRRFRLTVKAAAPVRDSDRTVAEQHGECGAVVMATGLGVPNVPAGIEGIEHTQGYESLPATGETFVDEEVAVFGSGNAAFETADALAPHAGYVHLWKGRVPASEHEVYQPEFVSWESRYVGSLRAINAGLLDSYHLKSLDAAPTTHTVAEQMLVLPCGGKAGAPPKVCVFLKEATERADGSCCEDGIFVGTASRRDPAAAAFLDWLGDRRLEPRAGSAIRTADGMMLVGRSGEDRAADPLGTRPLGQGGVHHDLESVVLKRSAITNVTVDRIAEFAAGAGTPYPMIYDRVIRCLGWTQGGSAFDGLNPQPMLQPNGKFPVLSAEYESVNAPGIYYAGAAAHGKDYRRSAGGFIHGFRYTTRALFRSLDAKLYGADWAATEAFENVQNWRGDVALAERGCRPGSEFGMFKKPASCPEPNSATNSPFANVLNKMFTRINTASGPYQMVAVLGDGIVFGCSDPGAGRDGGGGSGGAGTRAGITAQYYEEMNHEYFNTRFSGRPRLFWSFAYGEQRLSLGYSRAVGTLFQVHIWFYPGDCAAAGLAPLPDNSTSQKEVIRLMEHLHTNWDSWHLRHWVGKWLHRKVEPLRAGRPSLADWEQSPPPTSASEPVLDAAAAAGDEVRGAAEHVTDGAGLPQPGSDPVVDTPFEADMWYDEAPAILRQWQGGVVDMHIMNTLAVPVEVWQLQSADAESARPEVVATLGPMSGRRFTSHEREQWQVFDQDTLVKFWHVDLAKGILQDVVIR